MRVTIQPIDKKLLRSSKVRAWFNEVSRIMNDHLEGKEPDYDSLYIHGCRVIKTEVDADGKITQTEVKQKDISR